MTDEIKLVKIIVWPIAIIMVGVTIYSYITKTPLYEGQYSNNYYPSNTTGAIIIPIQTGSTDTGVIIEAPKDPRVYLDYIIKYGTGGSDYIAISPIDQPDMSSQVGSQNTENMHKYIYNNRIKIDIPTTNKQGYIMFVTSTPISNISNIFLGVDGSTIGRLDKEKSLSAENPNEYLYKLNSISLIGNNNYRFSKDLSKQPNIYINAVVGESNNKIEKIIIFFQ